jgi:hypothetical protein
MSNDLWREAKLLADCQAQIVLLRRNNAKLRAALEPFADRDNWLFIGGDADPVWMLPEKPWESASAALANGEQEAEIAALRAQLEHLLEKYPDERKVLAEFGYEQEPAD